ncbi:3-deoxy-manno-octulosonate cytidylyltransferase [Taylorella asinigenitalis]|uniref:3-deoxy-manno-octulosonate cytidylyltransferase n=1 Tax=Taylorella asinigenitalis (strain MCE3) TaxID=1008459 RepID=G4Q9S2_TAYAM|nr:3-deoxy-manno-octulosonate cytidylyltransferase [Taylorella asinigenitalis]AEP36688.1 3-deoxy-manno-octulosonate cytidylyltransferase [Taylorella asinigenitalis MCE3]
MFHIIIPARLQSTRLPRKMLLDLGGIPMIVRTAQRAMLSNPSSLTVATDSEEIFNICQSYKINCLMTRESHSSGSERLSEAVEKLGFSDCEVVVNVQGDEPFIDPEIISSLADILTESTHCSIATCGAPFSDGYDFIDPNNVKVIFNKNFEALYFSRAPIPWNRSKWVDVASVTPDISSCALHHIGIYAYKVSYLKEFKTLEPSELETVESLEQLRALYHGHKIKVLEWRKHCHKGIDTQEDLEKARQIICNL